MSVFKDLIRGKELEQRLQQAEAREREASETRKRLRERIQKQKTRLENRNEQLERVQTRLEKRDEQIERLRQRLVAAGVAVERPEGSDEHLQEEVSWHRQAIGGMWEEVGQLQFDFMREHGLLPQHYLLDVGCGSLRGGVHFIPYLEPGRYYGVDKSQELLDAGWKELEAAKLQDRRPVLSRMDDFGFERLDRRFDYALAQSVFSHLPLNSIARCLVNVDRALRPGGVFFATFFENREGKQFLDPLAQGDGFFSYYDMDPYHYTRDAFEWVCEGTGLAVEYVGDWGHPRNQVMMAFRKKAESSGKAI